MTPDYFRHCFRDAFGVSPQQLFLQEKLEQAQALLLQGRSVAETAAAVGMRDPKYFGRFFRSRMGRAAVGVCAGAEKLKGRRRLWMRDNRRTPANKFK